MQSRAIPASIVVQIFLLTALSWAQTASMRDGNAPVLALDNVQALPSQYVGPSSTIRLLESGQAKPVSLAHGDLNGDGIDGLVVGYAVPGGGGILSFRRASLANRDSFSSFSDSAVAFPTPEVPSFVAAGRFLAQADLVTAARGGNALYVFAGSGHGDFAPPQSFAVPGTISAMAAGNFGGDHQVNSVIVGINGPNPALLLYRRSDKGLSLANSYPLQAPVASLDFSDLDGDGFPDAVMVSGGRVLILHANGSGGKPQLETLSLPFSAVAVASGYFTHDRASRRQMAIVGSDGTTHIVVHGGFDPTLWTIGEVQAMRDAVLHNQPNPYGPLESSPATDGWKVLESFSGTAPASNGEVPLLLTESFFGRGTDDILILNSDAKQASFISHAGSRPQSGSFAAGRQFQLATPWAATTAVTMKVSHGQPGLVFLPSDSEGPLLAVPLTTISFAVNNTTTDTPDQNPGDGVCADANGLCSLRAAVMEVNAETVNGILGPFLITVPAANIQLTIPAANKEQSPPGYAATGHLDVLAPVTIEGTGVGQTTITQTNPNGDQDDVFFVDSSIEETIEGLSEDFSVIIEDLAITGGHATAANLTAVGGGIAWDAGIEGTGKLQLNNVYINANYAADPTDVDVDNGGGLALYNLIQNLSTPAVVNIAGALTEIVDNVAYNAGGGISLQGPVKLTMTGTTVNSNQAVLPPNVGQNQPAPFQYGGGLYSYSAYNDLKNGKSALSYIQDCTVDWNTAGTEGGGIWTNQSLTIDQGSLITLNTAAEGGGLATWLQLPTDAVTITASTITQNAATAGSGGGIAVISSSNSSSSLSLSFDRIFGNTPESGGSGTGLYNDSSSTVTANDNWWGCNDGPQVSGDGCDQISGPATVSTLVTLGMSATPSPVLDLSSTILTAALQDSNSNFSSNLNALINLPVTFSNPVNGTLSNESSVTNSAATATATFTANNSPTADATVQIDNAPVTLPIPVSDFSTTGSPTTKTVNIGTASTTFSIVVGSINGFSGTVGLAVTNASGLSASLSPNSVSGSGTVTLTVQTASAASGTYSITVTGTSTGSGGTITHQVTVQLTIADFTVSVSPSTQTVYNGSGATYTVTVTGSGGFTGALTLSVSGISSSDATFAENPLNLSVTTTSQQTKLTINAPIGTYSITVKATYTVNNVVRSASTQLVVLIPTYVPTEATTGGSEGGFNNLLDVVPGGGDSSAYDAGGFNSGTDNIAYATWYGFSGTGTLPNPAYLYVTANCTITSSWNIAEVYYSLNGGQTYTTLFYTQTSLDKTYTVALPSGQNLSELQVGAEIESSPNSLYGTYVEMSISDMYIQ